MKKVVLAVMLATVAATGAMAKPIHSRKCAIAAGFTLGTVYLPGAMCNPH